MKGDKDVIKFLNAVLKNELTAINQYFLHARMLRHWGLEKMGHHEYEESVDEMKHADELIERILFLDGVPNMQRLGPVRVGEAVAEQFKLDLELELDAVKRYNGAIVLCTEKNDAGTRELLEELLKDEESSVDWHEAQIGLIATLGVERCLAEQLEE